MTCGFLLLLEANLLFPQPLGVERVCMGQVLLQQSLKQK